MNRPPLARTRLEARPDGSVTVGMKRAFADGTSAFVYTPVELVERLCSLVPPPRANQVLYHGVLAANADWRREVVPRSPPLTRAARRRLARRTPKRCPRTPGWADRLLSVFQLDPLACRRCGQPLSLRCVVTDSRATRRILRTLVAPRGPPPAAS